MDFNFWKSDNKHKSLWIDIVLNNRCNYTCSYCHPWNWSKSEPWADVDKLLTLISVIPDKFPNKKIRQYNLMGGEPAITPSFQRLVSKIKDVDPNSQTIITTNGSRTARWFSEVAKYLDFINFSIHLERADLEELNQKMKICVENKCHVVANIMMDVNNWQASIDAVNFFSNFGYAHLIFLKPLEDTIMSGSLQKYSKEQLEYILNWTTVDSKRRHNACIELCPNLTLLHSDFYSAELLHDNLPYTHDRIIALGLNKFYGWKCWVGIDSFKIHANGEVTSGANCKLGKTYGNYMLSDASTWDWSNNPIVCKMDICNCNTDLLSRKFKDHTISDLEFDNYNKKSNLF